MRELVRRAGAHPVVRLHAARAVAGVPPGQPLLEVAAVRDYVAAVAEYRRDPQGVELLQEPWWVLACQVDRGQVPQLDCDDLTMLSLGLLGSLGHRSTIRVVSTRPDLRFNHVYGVLHVGDREVELDVTRAFAPPGLVPPPVTRKLDVGV